MSVSSRMHASSIRAGSRTPPSIPSRTIKVPGGVHGQSRRRSGLAAPQPRTQLVVARGVSLLIILRQRYKCWQSCRPLCQGFLCLMHAPSCRFPSVKSCLAYKHTRKLIHTHTHTHTHSYTHIHTHTCKHTHHIHT